MGMRDLLAMSARPVTGDPDNPRFIRIGARLMNQQCWCWGCDVRRTQGNLLLAFGFERQRPPADIKGSSRYRLKLRSGREVSLWGFGALLADGVSALHLDRFRFDPQLCAARGTLRPCWSPSDLPPLRRPVTTHELALAGNLCSELFSFIGDYESWVAETVGIRYRQQTVTEFQHATYSAAEAMLLWPRLAKQVARHYSKGAAATEFTRSPTPAVWRDWLG